MPQNMHNLETFLRWKTRLEIVRKQTEFTASTIYKEGLKLPFSGIVQTSLSNISKSRKITVANLISFALMSKILKWNNEVLTDS